MYIHKHSHIVKSNALATLHTAETEHSRQGPPAEPSPGEGEARTGRPNRPRVHRALERFLQNRQNPECTKRRKLVKSEALPSC